YLITFMLTFDSNRWYRRSIFWPFYFAALVVGSLGTMPDFSGRPFLLVVMYCLKILAVCMVCHGELALSKPAAGHLTKFYFAVASGGALGGAFVALIAPKIFTGPWEFYGALVACGYLLFIAFVLEDPGGTSERPAWIAGIILFSSFLLPAFQALIPGL